MEYGIVSKNRHGNGNTMEVSILHILQDDFWVPSDASEVLAQGALAHEVDAAGLVLDHGQEWLQYWENG